MLWTNSFVLRKNKRDYTCLLISQWSVCKRRNRKSPDWRRNITADSVWSDAYLFFSSSWLWYLTPWWLVSIKKWCVCVCICFSPRDDLMGERYRTRRCKGRRSIDRKRKQTITFFFRRARERERENIVPLLLRGKILTCRFFLSLSLFLPAFVIFIGPFKLRFTFSYLSSKRHRLGSEHFSYVSGFSPFLSLQFLWQKIGLLYKQNDNVDSFLLDLYISPKR